MHVISGIKLLVHKCTQNKDISVVVTDIGFLSLFWLPTSTLGETEKLFDRCSNVPRFALLSTEWRYRDRIPSKWMKRWPIPQRIANFGDLYQPFAIEELLIEIGVPVSELTWIHRDELNTYKGEHLIVLIHGWFNEKTQLIMSPHITPIYIGFHLQKSSHRDIVQSGVTEEMKKLGTIGCRDRQTAEFLKSVNVNAYFSSCLTLTFKRRQKRPRNGTTFIVDIKKRWLQKVPVSVRAKAKFVSQNYFYKQSFKTEDFETEFHDFELKARQQLKRFRNEAILIITSRVHVALPCTAMGIPVIFLPNDDPANDERLDVLRGVVKIYSYKDVVNWNPNVPDITLAKDLIKNAAIAKIMEVGCVHKS